jgi:hypothetical protein
LFHSVDATKEEGHAQDKQQIRQHTANQRSLDNGDLVLDQCLNRDNEFDGVSESGVEKSAERFTDTDSKLFGCIAQHTSKRDDSNKVDDEDRNRAYFVGVVDGKTNGDKDQEDVDPCSEQHMSYLLTDRNLPLVRPLLSLFKGQIVGLDVCDFATIIVFVFLAEDALDLRAFGQAVAVVAIRPYNGVVGGVVSFAIWQSVDIFLLLGGLWGANVAILSRG